MLTEATVVHWWFLVGVGHAELLTDVVEDQASCRDREHERHHRSKQESQEDNVDDESQSVVDKEQGA